MFSERSYQREDYPRERTPLLTWLLCSLGAGFVIQLIAGSAWFAGGSRALDEQLMMTVHGMRQGRVWTLLTHPFFHDTHYISHLIGNLLMIYFLGRELLPLIGERRFVGLFFGASVVGGLAWSLLHWNKGGLHFGATAAADAMLIVFACFQPNRQLDFLLFFVLPVSIKPKHLAYAFIGLDAFGLLLYELPGSALTFDVAHSAHLGGMLAGWIYFRFLHDVRSRARSGQTGMELPRWMKRSASFPNSPAASPTPGTREGLRAEVDRILDKINSQGFGSLTPAEKRVLDDAKAMLGRR
jgi:membrane associated rhomboid family serine protease